MSRAHLDSFSGGLGDLKSSDHSDDYAVLRTLRQHPRFSVFDATRTAAIAKTMDRLKDRGLIAYEEPGPGYPWSVAIVTEAGHNFLYAHRR